MEAEEETEAAFLEQVEWEEAECLQVEEVSVQAAATVHMRRAVWVSESLRVR